MLFFLQPALRIPKKRSGFMLIELLVVVLILGILLAVAIPLYLSSVQNSDIKAVKANMKTIATAAKSYQIRNGAYPLDIPTMTGTERDLATAPTGPSGVTYTFTQGTATVTALDGSAGSAVIGAPSATYNLSTGAWSPASFAN